VNALLDMFEGTELSLAYGLSDDSYDLPKPMVQHKATPAAQATAPPTKQTVALNPATTHSVDLPYNPPQAMYAQQTAKVPLYNEPSFWDRLGMRRMEVMKLVGFSLVILLAIAIDKVSNHYLTQYLSEAYLSQFYEAIVRISYPVGVILILWILKAL